MGDRPLTLRPLAVFLGGRLEQGLEVVLDGSTIQEIRPHTGLPDLRLLSPAFVNAHSHLEYGGLAGMVHEQDYWPWIRRLTELKGQQQMEEVRNDALQAAQDNRSTGVGLIGEHSDRPVSAQAMVASGLGGALFQEVITLNEQREPSAKLATIRKRADEQSSVLGSPVYLAAHSPYTVDEQTLLDLGYSKAPTSIHLAESPLENQFFRTGTGPIADLYAAGGFALRTSGETSFEVAERCGFLRPGAQLVHVCDLSDDEVGRLAASGAAVAHCPRSNVRLGCPPAKVRRLLDGGAAVGIGLDSPASSGPIDMFAEMRTALEVSRSIGEPLTAEQVWLMATTLGARSLGIDGYEVAVGRSTPLIQVPMEPGWSVEEVLAHGTPDRVEWVNSHA